MRLRVTNGGSGWRAGALVLAGLTAATSLGAVGAVRSGAATTSTGGGPSTTSPPAATTTTTSQGVATTTTSPSTPKPRHVIHQPDIEGLTPHIQPLRGRGVSYQESRGVVADASAPSDPSYLSSPGGPYIYDAQKRVVFLHGVNVVYKHPPYIAYPDPGKPWDFNKTDAQDMRSLGFNVVRLGIEWQALEPGSGGPNQRRICTRGAPRKPNEFNATVALRYLRHVAATVDLLARYGIYTLLDMHQDVYNQYFRGEGAPNWAVCTDNVPIVPLGGRWSNNYANAQLQTAVQHFWTNDVVGNLQGNYDLVWATVANYFKNDPWVIGYDLYNEPFSTETQTASRSTFTGQLECFYTGKAHTGNLTEEGTPLVCPPGIPADGLIPTIQSIDHQHLIFVEPDIYWVTGGNVPSQLGPMPFPRLVFNFHVYCGDRSPVTGNPTDLLACLQSEETTASEQDITRFSMGSPDQPTGPAMFMSEFGASTSVPLVGFDVEWAGMSDLSWIYWAWKYYNDPTGSSAEGLVTPSGNYSPVVTVLSRTYPEEVAGVPDSILFSPFTGAFSMVYSPTLSATGATTIAVAAPQHYPKGWCVAVRGGSITSKPGATRLTIETVGHPHQVYVSVTAGGCPSG